MLRPSKVELDSIEAMLVAGAESPRALAHDVIQEVERLRGEREQWIAVYQLSADLGLYQGYGPYPTRHMAAKQLPQNPMAQVANRAAVVPVLGVDYKSPRVKALEAEIAERETPKSHWSLVREWVEKNPGAQPRLKTIGKRR